MRYVVSAVLAVCLVTSTSLFAQAQCDSALVISTYKRFAANSVDKRLAVAVSKSAYDEIKDKEGMAGSIFGVRIGVSHQDYHQRAAAEVSSYSDSLSQKQVENVLWTGLDPKAPSVYSACLDAWVQTSRGLHLAVKAATQTDVTVVVSWAPVGHDLTEITPEWRWNLRGAGNTEFPATLHAGSTTIVLQRPAEERSLAVNYSGFTDSITIVPFPRPPKPCVKLVDAVSITPGGYMKYDDSQDLIVSVGPGGGPSENFSVAFDAPRAGTYSLEALWTSGSLTEVHIYYTKPLAKSCTDPSMNMDDADLHYLPSPRGGWGANTLPSRPDFLGRVLLPKGLSIVTFTSRSCGHGAGGGRLPSTRWVRFTESD